MARMDRRAQLRDLYGLDFPDELFEFWDFYQGLPPPLREAFNEHAGMGATGVCDVLAGRFDGVELRYPALLHWRYRLDHPELITVLTGDSDGLHWGFWFDDPREPPVVVKTYARDAYEFWVAGDTLFEAIASQIEDSIGGCQENIEGDPEYADDYRAQIDALNELARVVPRGASRRPRKATRATKEGMGVVVPRDAWDDAAAARPLDLAGDPLATCVDLIAGGKAGVALFHAKQIWAEDHDLACRIMERAYRTLGRDALAAIAEAHRMHPELPSVDMLGYKKGDFSSFAEAHADAAEVRKLAVGNAGVRELPDLSSLVNLDELVLWGNDLASLPRSLATCKTLRRINLFRNRFEAIPDVLAELPALVALKFGRNKIAVVGDVIGRCRALQELDLADNPITDLSDAIGALPALAHLDLSGARITRLPDSLGRSALQTLALTGSEVTVLPIDLSGWSQLRRVVLANTRLHPKERERLRAAAPNAEIIG
jgi:hypothetical protein